MRICQVPEGSLLAHQLAIDPHGKVYIQDAVVVNGQAQYNAD